jgi:guanylate kinase
MNQKKIFVITGPSGVGKTTLAKLLLERNKNLQRVVTYTTRPPRGEETDGVEYHFVDKNCFEEMITTNQLMEWAHVYGSNYYGEKKIDVQKVIDNGHDVILIIDPQGAKSLMEIRNDVVSIFIDVPSDEVLIQHLKKRGEDNQKAIKDRLENVKFDRSHIPFLSHVVINNEGELEKTVEKLERIINSSR